MLIINLVIFDQKHIIWHLDLYAEHSSEIVLQLFSEPSNCMKTLAFLRADVTGYSVKFIIFQNEAKYTLVIHQICVS